MFRLFKRTLADAVFEAYTLTVGIANKNDKNKKVIAINEHGFNWNIVLIIINKLNSNIIIRIPGNIIDELLLSNVRIFSFINYMHSHLLQL